jgi:hypothetical protein
MAYRVLQWPASVYPGEVDAECPEAKEVIAAVIVMLREQGPSPAGYDVKTLGQKMGGLWQINLKVAKRQIRILYAPDGQSIVLFRIHKKASRQEQTRAYELAKRRKREYVKRKSEQESHDRNRSPD